MLRLFLLALALNPVAAFAHATPVSYVPATSSILEVAPEDVSIRFSERIDQAASSIRVYAPNGEQVDDGKSTVHTDDRRLFSVGITHAGTGSYTVSWQVVSADDGHFTKGGFVFSVGQETASSIESGQFQVQHRSSWPEAITIWAELLGEALMLGCLLMLVLWKRSKKTVSPDAHRTMVRRLRSVILCATLLMLTGGICYVLLEASNLAVDQGIAIQETLRSFLNTITGRATVYRLALGLLFALVFFTKLPRKEWVLAIVLVAIAILRARVSHAAASTFLPALSIGVNAVHLLSKNAWIGGIIVFVATIVPALRREEPVKTFDALLRFASVLVGSLLIGGLTGVYIVWLHLKSFENVLTTHWGGNFLELSAFAAVLLLLRLFQQWKIHPLLITGSVRTKEAQETRSSLGLLLTVETFVGVAVLLYSSLLIITTPPLYEQNLYTKNVATESASVTFEEDPYEDSNFLITIDRPVASTGAEEKVTVQLTNTEKSIGPITTTMEERFPGGYVFPKSALVPAGTWQVDVVGQNPPQFDAIGHFTITIPADLASAKPHERTVGTFEWMMMATAVLIILLSLLLYIHNQKLIAALRAKGTDADTSIMSVKKPLIIYPLAVLITAAIGLSLGGHQHGSGAFREACRIAGGMWHENVPMRAGKATSQYSVLGCMIGAGKGTFHIANAREFAYFSRRTFALATAALPAEIKAGVAVTLPIRLIDGRGNPVTELSLEHDRVLHAVIVSSDQRTFAHLHTEDLGPITPEMLKTATFPIRYTFPHPGTYMLGVDFTIRAETFSRIIPITVTGTSPDTADEAVDDLTELVDGMDVRLHLPSGGLEVGEVQKLRYTFEEQGKPVTDLEPYLSATMHLSIVTPDLKTFMHTHGELPQTLLESIFNRRDPQALHSHAFLPDNFGPDIDVYVFFPKPGTYTLFSEVNRNGKTVLTRFRVSVPTSGAPSRT